MLAIKSENKSDFIDEKLFVEYDNAFMDKEKEKVVYLKVLKAYNDALRYVKGAERFIKLVEEAYGYGLMLKVKRPSKEKGNFGLYSPTILEDGRIHMLLNDNNITERVIKWETAYKYYQFKQA